jgi:pimeloyl-ACP methyl ester carboxylesterase
MGASVVQDFIIAYPDRVNKAILIAAGVNGYEKIHPVDSLSSQWYGKFAKALEEKDTSQAAVEFTKAWAEGIYREQDSLKAPVSKHVYQATLKNLQQHKMAGWPNLNDSPVAAEKLNTIKARVLIIHGDKDLPYISASSLYLSQQINGSVKVLLRDVAHMLNMEKPGEVNKLMLDFLKS